MGNTGGETRSGRSAGPGVSSGLDRVREVARKDRNARFTALLHHVSYLRLSLAFDALKKDAAPGTDGVSWREYDGNWQENLLGLHSRVQSGKYRAEPSRRVYIPKADGRLRPLGIASRRTRSSSVPSARCWARSARRTSRASPTGSGLGAASTMRWTRWRSGSEGG